MRGTQGTAIVIIAVIAVSIIGASLLLPQVIQPATEEEQVRRDLNLQGPPSLLVYAYHHANEIELTWTWYYEDAHTSYLVIGNPEDEMRIGFTHQYASEDGARRYTFLLPLWVERDDLFTFHVEVGMTDHDVVLGDVDTIRVIVTGTP